MITFSEREVELVIDPLALCRPSGIMNLLVKSKAEKQKKYTSKIRAFRKQFCETRSWQKCRILGKLCCINTLKCKGINITYNCYTVLLCILIFVIKFLLKVYHRFSYGGEMHWRKLLKMEIYNLLGNEDRLLVSNWQTHNSVSTLTPLPSIHASYLFIGK